MIYSVGIDLIQTARVKKALDLWGDKFAAKILGDEEMQIFNTRFNKVHFLAGRFAAKEAVIKAMGGIVPPPVFFRQIQILNDSGGKPYVHFDNSIKKQIMDKEIKLSLTHEREVAGAVAILTGEK
jgi:holo-[acyl-carrier protein] synthase